MFSGVIGRFDSVLRGFLGLLVGLTLCWKVFRCCWKVEQFVCRMSVVVATFDIVLISF